MEEENLSFVSNASNRPKSYGHNKYQLQLQEANDKIEQLNNIIKEKNDELELFKNNLRSFHMQLQDKNTTIDTLTNELNINKTSLETVTFDFNKLKLEKDNCDTSSAESHMKLYDENMELKSTIQSLHKTNNETVTKYNDLKVKYQTTLDLLEKKGSEYNSLEETNRNLSNELNLKSDLNMTQLSEIEILKEEVIQTRNELTLLKTQLYEKDIMIGELNKKMALEKYRIRGKITHNHFMVNSDEQDQYTEQEQEQVQDQEQNEEPIQQESLKASRTAKITTQRGVKLSRR